MNSSRATTAIDELIHAFFGAFDNRDGRVPTSAEIAALFIADAVIMQTTRDEMKRMTVAEFAEPRVKLLTSGSLRDFHEWETSNTTSEHGRFAVRISAYSKSGTLESRPYGGRGTKLFQLAQMDGGWLIVSLCWFDQE
jgi:hypothetical protein